MGDGRRCGFGRRAFVASLVVIAALVAAQSVFDLVVVLRFDRIGTLVDLDRSNGLPDLVSTAALGLGAAGAALIAVRERRLQHLGATLLAAFLLLLTLADVLHDGAHPASRSGPYVIALVLAAWAVLVIVAVASAPRARFTFAAAALILGASFFAEGLDRLSHGLERERGDPIAEYRIVAKEGLELLGWSLVALALWDEALRRGPRSRRLQRELLEHRLHRDDVPLEAELRVREARRDADQLREMEDRHPEVLPGLLLELRLPRVE